MVFVINNSNYIDIIVLYCNYIIIIHIIIYKIQKQPVFNYTYSELWNTLNREVNKCELYYKILFNIYYIII